MVSSLSNCLRQVGGLYWVAVTRDNVSLSLATELLMRLYWICRDYFGYVSEEVGSDNDNGIKHSRLATAALQQPERDLQGRSCACKVHPGCTGSKARSFQLSLLPAHRRLTCLPARSSARTSCWSTSSLMK